jgi:hypothetical protein
MLKKVLITGKKLITKSDPYGRDYPGTSRFQKTLKLKKSSKKNITERFTKAYQRGKFSRKSGDDLYGFKNSLKDLKVKL